MNIEIIRSIACWPNPSKILSTKASYRFVLFCLYIIGFLSPFLDSESRGDEAAPYTCQIEARQDENFDYAAVELWAPASTREVRGILCLVLHPLGHGGAKLAHPAPWIEMANRRGCALMAISFAQSDDPTANWSYAERGTGRALLAALDVLAQETDIPSLKTAPITIVGVCAAGQFAFHLTAFAPTRIKAFVTIGGGKHDLSKIEAAAKASALIIVTPDRAPYAVSNLNALYSKGRSYSAPWVRISENISNYDAGTCSAEVLSFLESSLEPSTDQSKMFRMDVAMEPAASRYLPISICGEKLPILAEVDPATITLKNFDSSPEGKPTCSLEVNSTPKSTLDDIFVPIQDSILHTKVEKTAPGQWKLDCWVDQKELPIGSSRVEVPIRFIDENKQILGGIHATLNCSVSGEVACIPSNLNFGTMKSGKVFKIPLHLVSKSDAPILISSIESTYPWIQMTSSSVNGDYPCTATPPADIQGQGFAGYFQVKLLSPAHRSLRIFYYGTIDKEGNSDQGKPSNHLLD
jgi:pimeloyl-ACP methyl ester carboxylesterase